MSLVSNTDVWTVASGPPLTPEQRRMVEEVVPLARAVVRVVLKRYPGSRHLEADLLAESCMGFVNAARHYSPAHGRSWKGYAFDGGFMRCRAWLRAMRFRDAPSVDDPATSGDTLEGWLEYPSQAPSADQVVLARAALEVLAALPPKEQQAVARLLDGRTIREVATDMGRCPERIRQLEARGLHQLRLRMGIPSVPPEVANPPSYASNAAVVRKALEDGASRTVREMSEATGYTDTYIRRGLEAVGAVKAGQKPGRRGPNALVDSWTLPPGESPSAR